MAFVFTFLNPCSPNSPIFSPVSALGDYPTYYSTTVLNFVMFIDGLWSPFHPTQSVSSALFTEIQAIHTVSKISKSYSKYSGQYINAYIEAKMRYWPNFSMITLYNISAASCRVNGDIEIVFSSPISRARQDGGTGYTAAVQSIS